ncbi:flagellar C1a complex subunit C1a-32-domain-containing protein [Chytridium lagenaria]|nr:flagellar C1a complex subunit C1a-32-domain-containing protein [Chytridium lagenaria]
MAASLVWRDISMKQVYDFNEQPTPEDAIRSLQKWFNIEDDTDRNGIVLDFYYYTLNFARDQQFTPDKASALFSIMKQTHERTISSPFVHMEKDFSFFKDLLLKHSVQRPPFSERIFSLTEVRSITEYALNTYFRHYIMYKYVFTKKVRLDFRVDNAEMTPKMLSVENLDPEISELISLDANGEPLVTAAIDPETGAPIIPTAAPIDHPPQDASSAATGAISPPPPNHSSNSNNPPSHGASPQPIEASTQPVEEVRSIGCLVSNAIPGSEPDNTSSSNIPSQEIAMTELKNFVIATLTPKLEELKTTLTTKILAQEEMIATRIKKIEEDEKHFWVVLKPIKART